MNPGYSIRGGAFLLGALFLFPGCGVEQPSATTPRTASDGAALAASHCTRCHTLPEPASMSRDEWPYMLAWMGNYLGHSPDIEINPALVDRTAVPPQPLVTREQFDAIRNHYLDQASLRYQLPPPPVSPPVSPLFEPVPFPLPASVLSMVTIDSTNQTLLIGTSRSPGLLILQRGATTPIEVPTEPVTFERLGNIVRLALIGNLGHDARLGQIVDFNLRDGTRRILVDAHPRIAAHRTADVDGDGNDDLLVCGFGDYPTGRVGIWWGGAGKLQEQILFTEAGTCWGDFADFDGDGDQDLVLAIANARPRLLAFVNEGGRRFVPRTIVDRPVGWGYNRCLLVDWDGDGKMDLVETSGNNLELRGRPIKSHHGLRVLRNQGNWKFTEVVFERLDGAIDVVAGDFDRNGRMDLAVTAFYPDWRLPFPTTLLLLMQRPDGSVERAGIADQHWNRWMRIAVGDADGDGDLDLFLGAAEVAAGIPVEHAARYEQLVQQQASALLLRNRTAP
jgi:hypothetical protein